MIRPLRSMLLAGLAAAALSAAVSAGTKEGVDAWQRGDYAAAVAEWKKSAATGDADAQFNLAQAYKLGRGIGTDLPTAIGLYRKAAEQGHEQAQDALGLLLFQNGDRAGAMPWIEKSAARGDPRAQYILGTALFNGDLAAKDWVRAYALMTRASAAGLSPATTSLTQMDGYLSADERTRGLAMANEIAAKTPPPIVATALPPSRPARVAGAVVPAPAKAPPKPAKPAPEIKTAEAAAPAPAKVRAAKPAKPAAEARSAEAAVPVPAKAPAVAAAAGGKWNVQLGAFDSVATAKAEWQKIKDKPGIAGLPYFTMPFGAYTRLRAGPLKDKAAATQVCAAAKAAGRDCFVVAP